MNGTVVQPEILLKDRATHPLYGYFPNLAAAIVFIVLFAVTSVAHFAQVLIHRQWWMIIMVIGTLAEMCGYIMYVFLLTQARPRPQRSLRA